MILIKRADGGVSLLILAEGSVAEEEVEKWKTTNAGYLSHEEVDSVPADRTFRNAWNHDLTVDMDKAREIQRGKLRALRTPKMEKLDVDFMRALESGDVKEQSAISAKKQALRDVTKDPALESAQTPEALKAVIPTILDIQ